MFLLSCSACATIFPETSKALEELPVDFWINVESLLISIGTDLYEIGSFIGGLLL